MKVTILGSGTCMPSLERSASGLLIETAKSKIVVDMGPGTMRRLLQAGVTVREVTHLFLTHFHPDHSGELVPFLFANKYGLYPPRNLPLTLAGGPGFKAFFAALFRVYGSWMDLEDRMGPVLEMSGSDLEEKAFEDFTLTASPMRHNPESVGFRVTDPRGTSVVCSGDTQTCAALQKLAQNAELAVFEASFSDQQKSGGHLTPSEAGAIAAAARVKRLVLTHFYPVFSPGQQEAECRKTWDGPLVLARDLLAFRVE